MEDTNLISRFNEFAHGYVFTPILIKVRPVLKKLKETRVISFLELCKQTRANPGPLRSILHSLQGMDIVRLQGDDVHWKSEGDETFYIPEEIIQTYAKSPLEYLESAKKPLFSPFFSMIEEECSSIQSSYLKAFLEGAITLPLIIALLQKRSNDAFSKEDLVSLEGVSPIAKEEILFIFNKYGLIDDVTKDQMHLTDEGKLIYHHALNYALGLSYRPMLRDLDTLLFGDMKALFTSIEGEELHVDRSLNVLSSGSMHKSYFRRVFPVILEIFNSNSMDTQPSYIIDTGCGDGTFLSELYQYIVEHTERGKNLDKYPLLMIGVDFNQAALKETRKTLTALNIPHTTLHGDIGAPAQILQDLSSIGIDIEKKILHIRSFLDHDRPYKAPVLSEKDRESFISSENVWISPDGEILSPYLVGASLQNHLQNWKEALKPQDHLMILEVHNLLPKKAFEERHQSISLHFDLLQSLSSQLLVFAETFFYFAAKAGLESKSCLRFPEDQEFTRITFHHFQASDQRVRLINELDKKATEILASSNRKEIQPQFSSWLSEELSKNHSPHFILEKINSEEKESLRGALYTTLVSSLDEIPVKAFSKAPTEKGLLHILDVHTSFNNPKEERAVLLDFAFKFFSLQGRFADFTYLTRPLEIERLQTPQKYLQYLLENKDEEVFSLAKFSPKASRWLPACNGYKRLLIRCPFFAEETSYKKDESLSKKDILQALHEEFSRLFPHYNKGSLEESLLGLGLDSLELGQFVRQISKRFAVKIGIPLLFKAPKLQDLAEKIADLLFVEYRDTNPSFETEVEKESALSLAQEPMWIWYELIGKTSAYNVPRIEHLKGHISIQALKKSLLKIAERHQILRSRYLTKEGNPTQAIIPLSQFNLSFKGIDLRSVSNLRQTCQKEIEEEINAPFSLDKGETFRTLLIRIQEDEYVLVITMHHMVTDGSSIPLFWHELVSSYNAFIKNQSPKLPTLVRQYFNWAHWQRESYELGKMNKSLAFWKKQMQNIPEPLDLPTDYPYPKEQTFNGNRIDFVVEEPIYQDLKEICKTENTTIFMALVAIWASFLARHSGQKEITIGTPWANRDQEEVQNLIGCFVNTLPLRMKVSKKSSFLELLHEAKKVALDAFEHAEVPFHKIVEAVSANTGNGRLPLYQTMVALEEDNGWIRGTPFEGTSRVEKKSSIYAIRDTSKFEISLSLREKTLSNKKVLTGEFVYNTDLFVDVTAQKMKSRLLFFIEQLAKNPKQDVFTLALETEEEVLSRKSLNPAQLPLPKEQTVFQLFEKQTQKTPEKTALIWEKESYSYKELLDLVQRFSSHLIKKDLKKEEPVALIMDRSPEMIVAILSLMRCGAAFVPIDPSYPENRQKFILEDLAAKHVITSKYSPLIEPEKQILLTRESLQRMQIGPCGPYPTAQNLVYILYTSGTTGTPKGVKISHGNLLNDITHMIEVQVPREDLSLSLFSTNIVFDQFVEELFPPLCTGNTVLLVDSALDLSWRSLPVTFMVTTPSQMDYVLQEPLPSSLKSLVLGGEILSPSLIQKIFEKTQIQRVYNSYGPTECTDQVACRLITREDPRVSLGKPISNCELYILDENQTPLPQGVWGELYIGGLGVGKGYYNREELTNQHFIKLPFAKGVLYKTGDVARWNMQGEIEMRGRIDFQVKIHGVRIEVGEIEHALKSQPGVKSAYVLKVQKKNSEEALVACVTPKELDVKKIRKGCAQFLSLHMLPEKIIALDELPLLSSGKADLKRLEQLVTSYAEDTLQKPKNLQENSPFEEEIQALFRQVLKKENLLKTDSFLASGGHSLLIVQILALIKERFGKRISMKDFMDNDTPKSLSLLLQGPSSKKEKKTFSQKALINYSSIPEGGSKILIIGGGVAGIMSAIECKKKGIPFQIVEKTGGFGGVWLHGCNSSSRLQTTSKVYDVDPSASHLSCYPNKSEMLTYLADIVSQHELEKYVSFYTEVKQVTSNESGFSIELADVKSGEKISIQADGILVCSGKHHVPHVPTWVVKDGAPPIVHASQLDGTNMENKRVLVVGAGSYAIEAMRLAHQQKAKSITLLSRKSYWVLPTLADPILYSGIREDLSFPEDYEKHLSQLRSWLGAHYSQIGIEHMIPRPEHQAFDAHISSCDDFFKIAQQKHVTLKVGEIDQLTRSGALLTNHENIEADLIIAGTGYKNPDLSFLQKIAGKNPSVYKGFMLAEDPRVGFVGFLDMVVSSTKVIPLNLELALKAMTEPSARPSKERVLSWLEQMPQEYLANIKSHIAWIHEEKAFLGSNQKAEKLIDKKMIPYEDKIAVESRGQKFSYKTLLEKAHSVSSHLTKNKYNRVLVILSETFEGLSILLGVLQTSATVFLLSKRQLQSFDFPVDCVILSRADYQLLSEKRIENAVFLEEICSHPEKKNIKAPSFEGGEYIFFTSGTTGKPKGVKHSSKSLLNAIKGFEDTCFHSMKELPRLLFQNKFSHLGGFMAALCTVKAEGTLVLPEDTSMPLEKAIVKYKPNLLIQMTSSFINMMNRVSLEDPLWSYLSHVVLGGEKVADVELKQLQENCPTPITLTYGISECGPLFKRDLSQKQLIGLGSPLPGVSYHVKNSLGEKADVGELYIKSSSLFSGYFEDKKATSLSFDESNFFKTKDFVEVRENSQLTYRGRKEDFVFSNTFVSDIENIILKNTSISEVVLSHKYDKTSIVLDIYIPTAVDKAFKLEVDALLKSYYPTQLFDLHIHDQVNFQRSFTGKIQRNALRKRQAPKVLLFAGQGAQHMGMSDDFTSCPAVKKLYQRSEEILGYDLLELSKKGPFELLSRTDICQVAIYVASIAELLILQEKNPDFLQECQVGLGLSLGEYTALVTSGVISFEDGLRLLALRGKLMLEASSLSAQSMISIKGLTKERVESLLEEFQKQGSIYLANDLNLSQHVIAGDTSSCEAFSKKAEIEGAIASPLQVSGAFHTPYMSLGASELAETLSSIEFKKPLFPILSNATAKLCDDPKQIKENLILQLDHPVQFSNSLGLLRKKGFLFEDFQEIGPKKVGLRIVKTFFTTPKEILR